MRNLIRLFAFIAFIAGSIDIQAQDNSTQILEKLKKCRKLL